MKHETLYKRTKTGAIQYWNIEVGYETNNNCPVIIKRSGQLGTTSPIVHSEPIKVGKNIGRSNETTPLEQAELQALSDWTKKHDEGYKTRQDLNINISGDLMHWSFNYIDYKTLTEALNAALPKFNSDANGNVKPMLATDWKKIKKVEYPCYIQPKLDGVRCLMIVDVDQDPVVRFLSRSGKDYLTLHHIASDVIKAVASSSMTENETTFILDGEVYSDEISFQELIQAVKKQYPNSLKLKFRAYDIVNDSTQHQRLQQTQHMVRQIGSEHVTMVETQIVDNVDQVKRLHDEYVQAGNEGAILRLFEGYYGQGQRSRDLLKVKEFNETEYTFLYFEKGQRDEDLIAVCDVASGQLFRAKMEGNRTDKEAMFTANTPQGSIITIKHFGWTDGGLPRFPIGKGIRDYE